MCTCSRAICILIYVKIAKSIPRPVVRVFLAAARADMKLIPCVIECSCYNFTFFHYARYSIKSSLIRATTLEKCIPAWRLQEWQRCDARKLLGMQERAARRSPTRKALAYAINTLVQLAFSNKFNRVVRARRITEYSRALVTTT